jgi:hypothetical protein
MTAISNSDLRVLVIPVRLMPSVYYVTKLRKLFNGSRKTTMAFTRKAC